ncbi:MAG: hypothetical protein ACLQU3_13860, partial [Limisphaerales bacterium]
MAAHAAALIGCGSAAALAMLGAGPAARCRLDDSTERDCLFALQKLLDFGLGLGQADSWIL